MQELLPPPGIIQTLPDGSRLMSRPKSGGMGVLEAVRLPPEGRLGDKLELWGEAHVRNGPGKCLVPGCGCGMSHQVARNKIVGQGLRHIANMAFLGVDATGASNDILPFETNDLGNSYIRVGTGSGATSDATTGLAAQVATNPTATTGGPAGMSNPSSGVYRFSFTAVWNAGAITGATVTEIGVFGRLTSVLGTRFNTSSANAVALQMFARLSVTDAEFSSFVINTAAPLVIEYRVTLTFT